MEPYKIVEVKNGDVSHYEAVDCITGKTVWSSAFPKATPVSDEDIDKVSSEFSKQRKYSPPALSFEVGAKWMRDRLTTEAESFAEWLKINDWEFEPEVSAWFNNYGHCKTTSELLQIFRNKK